MEWSHFTKFNAINLWRTPPHQNVVVPQNKHLITIYIRISSPTINKYSKDFTMNKYLKDGASFWKETEENAFCLSLWCYIRDQAKAWLSSPAPHCANLAPGRLMGWLQITNSRSKRTHGIGREGERYLFLVACAAARLLSLSPPHRIFMT